MARSRLLRSARYWSLRRRTPRPHGHHHLLARRSADAGGSLRPPDRFHLIPHRQSMNITDEIFRRCDPAATALVEGETVVTYGALRDLMERAAASLERSPLFPPHPRVAISIPNGIDHIVWSLAVLKAGGTLVPVPGELAMPERAKLTATTAVHCLIATAGQPWTGPPGASEEIGNATLHGDFGHAPSFNEAALSALNPALIRFSSGTTGRSKG
ncbi:MAG: hypothetical protein EOP87_09690, partial [Verrucomicrobiaceae bacterium]